MLLLPLPMLTSWDITQGKLTAHALGPGFKRAPGGDPLKTGGAMGPVAALRPPSQLAHQWQSRRVAHLPSILHRASEGERYGFCFTAGFYSGYTSFFIQFFLFPRVFKFPSLHCTLLHYYSLDFLPPFSITLIYSIKILFSPLRPCSWCSSFWNFSLHYSLGL